MDNVKTVNFLVIVGGGEKRCGADEVYGVTSTLVLKLRWISSDLKMK